MSSNSGAAKQRCYAAAAAPEAASSTSRTLKAVPAQRSGQGSTVIKVGNQYRRLCLLFNGRRGGKTCLGVVNHHTFFLVGGGGRKLFFFILSDSTRSDDGGGRKSSTFHSPLQP